jgi:hypothetical protein
VTDDERAPWERRPHEPARAHDGFRRYRDAGPLRSLSSIAEQLGVHVRTVKRWSARWDWPARAISWDDEAHRADDRRRLEALRSMHDTHQRAGRAAIAKALAALHEIAPADVGAASAARLLEIGTRLERQTLTISVEELQNVALIAALDDPWDAIARELQGGA